MTSMLSTKPRFFAQLLLMIWASLCLSFAPAAATDGAALSRLMDALKFKDVTHILAQEGRALSKGLTEEDLGIPLPAFNDMLAKLYDEAHMYAAFEQELDHALEGTDVSEMVAFFESDLGQKISRFELETRRALAEEGALAAASAAWAALDPQSKRAQMIEDYVTTNDLVEMNVVGAMNSDLAYYQGLWQFVEDPSEKLSDEDLLRTIWSSEPDVRADVSEWIYGFSYMAYDALSDEEFARYVDFAHSQAGQQLNFALFAAFDAAYDDISRGLGTGTGALMQVYSGQEL